MLKTIFHTIFVTGLIFLSLPGFAKTFYFSSSTGDDSRSIVEAQQPATPWTSLAKLNSVFRMLMPGDSVRFKCGDVFVGELIASRSGLANKPLIFDHYGEGEKPVLTTMIEVDEFTSKGGDIYEANIPALNGPLKVLTLGGVIQAMGRFPNADTNNKGYLTIQSANENTLTSNQLRAPAEFTNAEIVIRKNNWIIDKHVITSHSGRNISYDPEGGNSSPKHGYGFFIQNHPATLDQFGEWYLDSDSNKLLIYSDRGDLASQKVKVATGDRIIRFLPKISNLSFNNLILEGSNKHLISVDQGSNIRLDNCDLFFSGDYAIHAVGSTGLLVEDSKIADALNGAIFLQYQDRGLVVRNTSFDRIASFPGMGKNSEMQGVGIYMSETSSDGLIECNKFTNLGYVAINFNGNNTVVRNNLIDTFCTVKDDGAAIYTYTGKANTEFSGRKVINNIILNGTGAVEGTKPYGASDFPYVEGIYIDDNASGVEIKGNLIANVKGSGIYLHNARNISIKGNHIYNAGNAVKLVHDDLGDPIRNIEVSNNYFLNKSKNQQHVFVRSKENDIERMGEFDNNVYVGPRNDNMSFGTEFPNTLGIKSSSRSSLNEWKSKFGMDKSSKQETLGNTNEEILNEFGEIKMSNGDFEFPVPEICWVPQQIPSEE